MTIGRDRERETIAKLLDATHASLLLLEGHAGIGKTTLLRAGIDEARARGYRVLACAPAPSETQLSFAGLRDLLDTAFDEVAKELPLPQRRALAVVLLRELSPESPPQPDAIAVAFVTVLRALSARGRTLVAIDDVQWLDPASAAAISYAIRRLDPEAVMFLLARRLDNGEPLPLELDRATPQRIDVARVGPLSVGATGRLINEHLGFSYARATLRTIHEVSGGNPFYAIELARALGHAAPLRPGEPLPLPDTLRELVQKRIDALPEAAVDVLTVASALVRPTIAILAAVLGLDAASQLAPAINAHVAAIEGDQVHFTHPLFATAIYARVPPDRRREIHRRAADIVVDVEGRARHLALATLRPDQAIAQAIEEGAREAFVRGGTAAAAELAGEARRLTPSADRDAAWRRSLAEADYQFAAGDTPRATAVLAQLVADAPTRAQRARALSRQARLHHFERDVGSGVSLLYQALAEAGDDAALRAEIEEGLAWGLLLIRRDLRTAVEHARSAARFAEQRGDAAALAEALAAQALTEFVLGRPSRATMERALSLEGATLHLRVLRHPTFANAYCLSCADDLDGARTLLTELMRRALEHGDESSPPSLLNHLTMVELLAGNWSAATAHAEEGYERAFESGQQPARASILGKRALIEARRGALDDAQETALRSLAIAAGPPVDSSRPAQALMSGGETAVWALGFIELARGDAERAYTWLGPLCDALLAADIEEPGEVRALPDAVEALIALERLADAEVRVRHLAAWARRVERPSVSGAAALCRGLLLAAKGEPGALAALEEAASWHERSPVPFERARTLLALGAQQRRERQRRRARDTLQRAEAIYQQLGSDLGLQKTRAEISRIGGRRASGDDLTPTERQIATFVAEGKKNREVAAALVVSERTVEAALTVIYRKLDVRSRTELARKLARPD